MGNSTLERERKSVVCGSLKMESKGTFFFLFFFGGGSSQLNFVVVVKIHEEREEEEKKGAPREGRRRTDDALNGGFLTRETMAGAGVRSFGALLFFRRDDLPTMIIRKILFSERVHLKIRDRDMSRLSFFFNSLSLSLSLSLSVSLSLSLSLSLSWWNGATLTMITEKSFITY